MKEVSDISHVEVEDLYYRHGEDAITFLETEADIKVDLGAGYRPSTCNSGIQRFTNGTSNSIQAFENS